MKRGVACSISVNIFLLLMAVCNGLEAQSYKDDSLAVRSILDSNGLFLVGVEEVAYVENNRITELLFFYDSIVTLPAQIGQLSMLKNLTVIYNSLTTLPSQIGSLSQLQTLNLTGNFISTLPTQIGSLSNLKILNVSSNGLEAVPAEIGKCTALDTFDVSMNSLSALPAAIGSCTNLKSLYLSNNLLTSLPQEIGNLPNIKSLGLRYNTLTTLPSSITAIKPTLYCDLGNNRLKLTDAAVKAWADQYDPDWEKTQETNITAHQHHDFAALSPLSFAANHVITYSVPVRSMIRIDLFAPNGRLIKTPVSGFREPGQYQVYQRLPAAGMYFGVLTMNDTRFYVPFFCE